jgi:hypothetical protein
VTGVTETRSGIAYSFGHRIGQSGHPATEEKTMVTDIGFVVQRRRSGLFRFIDRIFPSF